MKIMAYVLSLLFAVATPCLAVSDNAIGHINTLNGSGYIVRGGAVIPAKVGAVLHRADLVRTGKPGSLGVVLTDDTTISLGPNSELSLAEYEFNPREGKFSLVVRMMKGTFAYLSGMIARLAPGNAQIVIPDATIAVRGTKLLIAAEE